MAKDVKPRLQQKLSGFLRLVLSLPSDSPQIPLNSICHVTGDPPNAHFLTQNGAVLSDIFRHDSKTNLGNSKKRWSKIGVVNGSVSVVQQLGVLVGCKCLSVVARVIGVLGKGEECRVVVLVDVYLPVSVWSCDWQFTRSKALAAAVFKHLSCDWEARSSMLESFKLDNDVYSNVWNVTDCHVLGCKNNCSSPDNPKKKQFELQEIFKSLPCATKKIDHDGLRVNPAYFTEDTGISDLSDDILISILVTLRPVDLLSISLTCHHLRFLASSIMPCMKLKLYPHQQAAVDWMLNRERESKLLPHPLYMDFKTEDGFDFCINVVSGEITTGVAPTIKDFHGGMFCDEPGLGKTITSLSLILKTQGTLAEIPNGVSVIWCIHDGNRRCGYYDASRDNMKKGSISGDGNSGQKAKRGKLSLEEVTPKKTSISGASDLHMSFCPAEQILDTCSNKRIKLSDSPRTHEKKKKEKNSEERVSSLRRRSVSKNKDKEVVEENLVYNETWVQCDSCSKWRRLADGNATSASTAWFCVMNNDPLHQSCNVPEESWDNGAPIMYLPGFHEKGTHGPHEENISYFVSVLKEHRALINTETNTALTWLAKLSPTELAAMETVGLPSPAVGRSLFDSRVPRDYHKIFRAFGLTKRVEKNVLRWYYPKKLVNLEFDLDSLRIAICEPLDSLRLYLSSATLIVVPSNLVDHWKTQIEKHVTPGQLKVYIWGDQKKKPPPHNLAWDYDVVITTFTRLSAEWGPRKRSVLVQVHWLRIMLDEGHTLGLSVSLTNKLQMAVSLIATNRWLLTGTPTPNTPSSQLSSLQPMLKFLQEEAYGLDQKSWDNGVLKPFEAEMEEGRLRLLQLLQRSMISARKIDLQAIPPCIKKVTFVDFSEGHAKTYNELVETVRRNILLADWNDPSHVESLLNPKQWKFRSTTIRNVRLSCCVAGHVRVSDAGEDIQETMDILVEKGLDSFSEEYVSIKIDLMEGRSCMRCKQWCRLPVITPCRHLLCLQCVALDSEKCAFSGCGHKYEMQNPETLARPENPNPKWPVPKDLIELQPAYKQDDWNPDWESTSSSKVTYLVDRLKKLQETNRMMMIDNSVSEGDNVITDDRNSIYGRLSSTSIDSKAYNDRINGWNRSSPASPEKVIIFSQFLEHIHVIEQQLTIAGIEFMGMYCPMNSISKMKSLTTFQHDPNCMVLVMDGSAALGLDLSFVNHVYLMEPIWDRSMEEQVISRAHRMGAVRPINVETLAMKGTIEEQMVKFLQDSDGCKTLLNGDVNTKDLDSSRSHRTLHDFAESNYLSHLSFVRTKSQA